MSSLCAVLLLCPFRLKHLYFTLFRPACQKAVPQGMYEIVVGADLSRPAPIDRL